MVAGPSEVSIVADKYADPELVAADLMAQANMIFLHSQY